MQQTTIMAASSSSTGELRCDHSMVVEEMSRAYELTRRLQEIVLPSSHAAHDLSSDIARDMFKDVLLSLGLILNELRPCLLSREAVECSEERDDSDGSRKRRKVEAQTTLTTVPHHDGYQWRKYGQKQINNSKFPRNYYRCSHHKDQGCLATKTVQQIDGNDDPPKFSVTFSKQHTCKIHIETCSPFVMDSSCKPASNIISESSFAKKEDDPLKGLIRIKEFETLEEIFLSGPVTPVSPMEDITLLPINLWDFGVDWWRTDESSYWHDLNYTI